MPSDMQITITFLIQVVVLLSACKFFGYLGKKYLGQAQVTMEMLTGVILGPSAFGLLFPAVQNWLFPQTLILESGLEIKHPNMAILYVIAQIGLVLYMFLVGLEFDPSHIRTNAKASFSISVSGIIAPFGLAALTYATIKGVPELFIHPQATTENTIFLGAAMCITAFPMLARIMYEAGLSKSPIGVIALSAGAFDDLVAWLLLALVISVFSQNHTGFITAIGGTLFLIAFLATAGRWILTRLVPEKAEHLTQSKFVSILIILFICAAYTDYIGIFAVFGAFAVGAVFPKTEATKALQHRIEPLTVGLLLPFFFAFSGLNTKMSTISQPDLLILAAILLVVAIAGKLGGCYIAARINKVSHPDALKIGILMNSRGLMELIIINVGLEKGIITQELFAMLVIMAIVTTFIASPVFKWASARYPNPSQESALS